MTGIFITAEAFIDGYKGLFHKSVNFKFLIFSKYPTYSFQAKIFIFYPLGKPESLCFSDVSIEYKKGTSIRNELINEMLAT